MRIIDLAPEHEALYCVCLEDWSEEMKEAGDHKQRWCEKMKSRGLRVKLAEDDNGKIGGMIQYVPIESSPAQGEGLFFIHCIWVHGYKEGRGDFRKQGMGKALLKAAEQDTVALGKKGLVAWGVSLPFFMRASWYKKRGYKQVDKDGIRILLWKPFDDTAVAPHWVRQKKRPDGVPGYVTVSAFMNGCCPAQNIVFERAETASDELGEKVIFKPYDTSDDAVFEEWGIFDGLYIDSKQVRTGPPPPYKKIRNAIEKKLNRLPSGVPR